MGTCITALAQGLFMSGWLFTGYWILAMENQKLLLSLKKLMVEMFLSCNCSLLNLSVYGLSHLFGRGSWGCVYLLVWDKLMYLQRIFIYFGLGGGHSWLCSWLTSGHVLRAHFWWLPYVVQGVEPQVGYMENKYFTALFCLLDGRDWILEHPPTPGQIAPDAFLHMLFSWDLYRIVFNFVLMYL